MQGGPNNDVVYSRFAPKTYRAPADAWVLEGFGGITATSEAVLKEDGVGAHERTISQRLPIRTAMLGDAEVPRAVPPTHTTRERWNPLTHHDARVGAPPRHRF